MQYALTKRMFIIWWWDDVLVDGTLHSFLCKSQMSIPNLRRPRRLSIRPLCRLENMAKYVIKYLVDWVEPAIVIMLRKSWTHCGREFIADCRENDTHIHSQYWHDLTSIVLANGHWICTFVSDEQIPEINEDKMGLLLSICLIDIR